MSLQYVYSIHDQDFIMPCPDPHVLEKLFEHEPENMEHVFGAETEDEFFLDTPTATVSSDQILKSINQLLLVLKTRKDIIPYTCRLQCSMLGGNSTSKGIGGIRLPGDEHHAYSIMCNMDTCKMKKWGEGSDGKGVCIEEQDVGHLKELETANMGTIKILKRRRRITLTSNLKDLSSFLQEQAPGVVTIRLV